MATVFDSATQITTTYYYDLLGRALYYTKADASGQIQSVQYTYDEKNNLSGLTESVGNSTQGYTYNYDPNNRITSVVVGDTTVTYEYDAFSRLTQKVTKQGETVVKTEVYTFVNWTKEGDATNYTTAQVATYAVTAGGTTTTWTYTYDANGNILTISDGTHTTSYVYDSANQLVEEYNEAEEYAHFWVYDNAGNIKSRTEYRYENSTLGELIDTVNYTYGDTGAAPEVGDGELPIIPWSDETATNPDAWGDLLTAYDGNAITYDGIGNPLNDGTWIYEWQRGRQLKSMTNIADNTVWTYTYDADGMRTSRTNGTTTYTYTYNGSQLVQMTVGDDVLRFTYDAAGTPLSVNYNGTTYYYVTNIQGDVVAIVNASGAEVASYAYDAWGKFLLPETTAEEAESVISPLEDLNPLRYRGYVYDTETELYYLQSRYYDPEIGRFINPDNIDLLGANGDFASLNLYAYCGNNPVCRVDANGHWWEWLTAAVTAVVTVTAIVATAAVFAAVAPAAICSMTMVGMSLGIGYTAANVAATAAAVVVTTAATAYVADAAFIATTGESFLLDTVFQGNEEAYAAGQAVTSVATGMYFWAALMSPGVCFAAGTPILTEQGYIAIEEIMIGDMVWAENPETGEKELKEVVQTFVNETTELIYVYVDDEVIITTPEHPFYSPVNGWVAASTLYLGDTLALQSGKCAIVQQVQHKTLETPITVYNFEVADFHTYYVGKSAVLVHNVCVVREKGVKVEVRTSNEHGVPHGHVSGNGPNTTIGLDGMPMKNHPWFSQRQQEVISSNWGTIRDAIKNYFPKQR